MIISSTCFLPGTLPPTDQPDERELHRAAPPPPCVSCRLLSHARRPSISSSTLPLHLPGATSPTTSNSFTDVGLHPPRVLSATPSERNRCPRGLVGGRNGAGIEGAMRWMVGNQMKKYPSGHDWSLLPLQSRYNNLCVGLACLG
jgi:hypothetical protein